MVTIKERSEFIDSALSKIKPDIVLENGKIINVYTDEIVKGDIAIYGNRIVGMYDEYNGKKNINVNGKYVCPGLIDGHIHIESSMLTISEFCKAVVPHGTTAVIADPHEIANVLGVEGIQLFRKNAEKYPFELFLTIPSCVPATNLETSGARITVNDIAKLIKLDKIVCLGELMNYPGVINKDLNILKKIDAVRKVRKRIDGHAPLLRKKELSAYMIAGVNSDHESVSGEEALEKVRKGMYLMIRQGSAAKNMKEILTFLLKNDVHLNRCMFVSDDMHPSDLMKGHMDYIIKEAIKLGLDPLKAIKMSSFNVAKHFGLRGNGSLGVGKIAHVVVLDSLKTFKIDKVISNGKLVAANGKMLVNVPQDKYPKKALNSVRLNKVFSEKDFEVIGTHGKIRVIRAYNENIVTKTIYEKPRVVNGKITQDVNRDLLKIAVIERHKGKNNFTVGFVKGFKLKHGAIASTVSHDSHNIVVIGTTDKDMALAVNTIGKIQGGFVVVGKNIDYLQLNVAGLISTRPLGFVKNKLEELQKKVKAMGCEFKSPFMTMGFLALPVIPELKITDKGLVENFKFVKLSD